MERCITFSVYKASGVTLPVNHLMRLSLIACFVLGELLTRGLSFFHSFMAFGKD